MERCRRAGRTWFGTYWRKGPVTSLSMPTAGSRSICSISPLRAPPPGRAAGPELRRPARPGPILRGAEREAVALLAEPSAPRLQPRFARCCGPQRRRSRTLLLDELRRLGQRRVQRGVVLNPDRG